MIDEVRGCDACATKVNVVVLRASGADGYNDYIYKMNGADSVETLVVHTAEEAREVLAVAVNEKTSVVVDRRGLARRPRTGFTLVNVLEGKPTDNLY